MKFKKEGKVLLIIVISAAMAVISMFMTDNSDKLFCSIKRPEPGEESQVKRINVVGEDGESITSVDVEIAPRIMTQDEAAGCFEKAYEEIAGIMCGRNKDLEHVTSNLVLPETAQRGVVSLTWYSGNYELINYNGNVNNIGFSENECQNVELKLIMEYEDYKSEYDFAVTVYAREYSTGDSIKIQAQKDIEAAVSSSRMDENINLPQYIADSKVHYEESEKPVSPLLFVLLGGAAILVVIIADKKKVKDNAIKRKKELLYDYSEVVSKLTLLLGAGMTTRMAWHKIAADYKNNIEHGKAVRRPVFSCISTLFPYTTLFRSVYDEICKTDYNIQAGISELKAYEQFGKRCDTREYMKLAALLQTNIRKGTKELRRLLEEETADAFEKRKNMAKIKGEEATTKLLMPMMMMLMIVMAIIMIPAVWSFQI